MRETDKVNSLVILILFGLQDLSTMEISEAMLPKSMYPKEPLPIQDPVVLDPVVEIEEDFATVTIPVVKRVSPKVSE